MTDTLPDRLCASPDSPFFNEAILERGIGVRFKGEERFNVEEYCISGSWVRMAVGRTLDRKGRPMTVKVTGPVEVWFKDDEKPA